MVSWFTMIVGNVWLAGLIYTWYAWPAKLPELSHFTCLPFPKSSNSLPFHCAFPVCRRAIMKGFP